MTTRIGINGFGRMVAGGAALLQHQPDLQLVHVNERERRRRHRCAPPPVRQRARPLPRHRRHRRLEPGDRRNRRHLLLALDSRCCGWEDHDVDIVLECTGAFRSVESLAPFFEWHVCKVIVAAPVKDDRAL